MTPPARADSPLAVRHLDLTYEPHIGDKSALSIVYALLPEWQLSEGEVSFVRFTDGITNTLLKAEKHRPGYSQSGVDDEAVLLRAYGAGTDILIDREREIRAHSLLAIKGLAPPLLARFNNGLLYKFIPGDVCTAPDLSRSEIYRGVAEKLGQWHGSLSIDVISDKSTVSIPNINGHVNGGEKTSDVPLPNLWSVTQSWIDALPAESDSQRDTNKRIQAEFNTLKARFIQTPGLLGRDYIFGHCDLLSGNVIVQKPASANGHTNGHNSPSISFIDYEYSAPAPAAFDIANHFAEWCGLECDYTAIPRKSQRREFIDCYVKAFLQHASSEASTVDASQTADQLYEQVDMYRGVPGFYWGVWALIQAQISQIDFDYTAYAEERFSEYYAWKAEIDGSRKKSGKDMPLRERTWSSE